jgi:hydroxymethylbilane synthase
VSARVLRAATRGSPLARWQAEHVAALIRAVDPAMTVALVVVDTQGDRRLDVPIWELGGKGVFAKEVQAAVLDGRADLAVHSAKDLPSVSVPGLVLAAVPERGDPRDALVGSTLADLPEAAEVATGSLRRRVALWQHRPDLRFVSLRGNMQTRLAKAADHDAVVVAATALDRLGLAGHIAERLGTDTVVPQVGQAALAVECREDDAALRELLARIEHGPTRRCVDAERAFLAELGGDCSLPAGAHATIDGDDLVLTAFVAAPDGSAVVRATQVGRSAALGADVARRVLADGGARLLGR